MEERVPILSLDDIKNLVDTFYGKIREDELLGPIFHSRIQDRWEHHLGKMYSFWQTTLLGEHTYSGRPFPPHATLPVAHEHFARWIKLFTETVDELFTGEKADEAKWRAEKIAEMFEIKVHNFQQNNGFIL
ncbi:group III truncated hemoglobin [Mucilaginibacter myungsuensis]|uniref:Group III truncated hemoglobin n=1 Tax=Mucilaginibacter myungsuensis TaxID=649104 RepID=A0A929PZK1_9SPHI|nr:group III truncated hemoglobin [Mucilaginibacter myungsuensis]MBE9664507.1 group III truncated hemoglobin [Mucilaginibacter myungsuensis]MDN3601348.1 group III truncated hemoglobin [Mucilaginibacter myungsuensis]